MTKRHPITKRKITVVIYRTTLYRIVKKIENLKSFPSSGVLDKSYSSSDFTVHHITMSPNVIYYLQEKDSIVVMTIIHVKRSPCYVNNVLNTFLENFEI